MVIFLGNNMRKAVVWVITHGHESSVKMLNRQLALNNITSELIVHIKCNPERADSTFQMKTLRNHKLNVMSEDEQSLKDFLPNFDRVLTLSELLVINNNLKKRPFVDANASAVFIDANLGSPSLPHITNLFHTIVHCIGSKLFSIRNFFTCKRHQVDLILYPFSQNEDCCDEANNYLSGEETPPYVVDNQLIHGFRLKISVRGIADDKTRLMSHVQACNDSSVRRAESTSSETVDQLSSLSVPRSRSTSVTDRTHTLWGSNQLRRVGCEEEVTMHECEDDSEYYNDKDRCIIL
jgi:hypothetical protein